MSEWNQCFICGAMRENQCACPNPECSDFNGKRHDPPTIRIETATFEAMKEALRGLIRLYSDVAPYGQSPVVEQARHALYLATK